LSDRNGDVFSLPDVTVVNADPRNFLHQNTKKFDIIHLGGTEALSAASGGTRSLYENYLLTNEGFQLCLNSLSSNGLVTATTGIQTPPRDSIKLLATATEALEALGTAEPSSHLALFSNYLAATVLASKNRFSSDMGHKLTKACNALRLDRQWHPLADRKQEDQQIHTDAGQDGSYLQDAAAMLFSDHRDQFMTSGYTISVRQQIKARIFIISSNGNPCLFSSTPMGSAGCKSWSWGMSSWSSPFWRS
ncbi:MAG: hypothetical protein ACLFQG_05015, partial [Desulfovermiculus sp.]